MKFDIGSTLNRVFTTSLAARLRVSMASWRFPTRLPTIRISFEINDAGSAVAIGTCFPSGTPTHTRVPAKRKTFNAAA
ncbi:hypothetical protein TMatcc_008887 [Talaromyces marneffei ATCC 18224]